MPFLMACIISAGKVTDKQISTPERPPYAESVAVDSKEDIVVTARMRGAVSGATTQYSEIDISLFRALTVGEIVDNLQRRNGGRPISVIINGRRIADYSDILQIPPEALAALQILPPTKATAYGLSPTSPVLNIVLKERYSGISADGSFRVSTEGGNRSLDSALRPVQIRGDRRLNAALQAQASSALDASSRLGLIDAGDIFARYRTLLPATRSFGGNAGWAMLVGQSSLTLTGAADQKQSRQLTRFFTQNNDKDAAIIRGVEDASENLYAQGSATLSGVASDLTWSVELTSSYSKGRSYSHPRERIEFHGPVVPAVALLPSVYSPINVNSTSVQLGLAMAGSANILHLPAGQASVNLRISTSKTWLKTDGSDTPSRHDAQSQSRIRLALEAPLIDSNMDLPVKIGSLTASASGEISKFTAYLANIAYDASLTWQPRNSISIILGIITDTNLPSATSIYNPVIYNPGALISDPVLGEIVPATRISGGNPFLIASLNRTFSATLSYNTQVGNVSLYSTSEYIRYNTKNPVILTAYPSIMFERIFPERFEREKGGQLTSIDTRPFNAAEQWKSILRINLRLSGHFDMKSKKLIAGGGEAAWDLSITDDWLLNDILYASCSGNTINLLNTPIDSAQGVSTHRLGVEGSGLYGPFGLRLGANWRSGSRSSSLSSSNDRLITQSFLTADLELSWTMPKRDIHPNRMPLRMWISIANLLNNRISIKDQYGRIPIAYRPAFTDPLGRVVSLKISQSI